MIKVNGLSFAYEDEPVLNDINLDIEQGSISVLLGPSGCGKSTLCKCLCGIIPKALSGEFGGEIIVDGKDISTIKLSSLISKIGLVMQEPDLQIVQYTVEDDVAFAPENLCVEPVEIRKRVDAVLSRLKLESMGLRNPSRISGGEKQRVAIAGILALEPGIIVFDEPMSALDEEGKTIFIETVKELSSMGKTLVIAEHDFDQLNFADRWIEMLDGKIIREATPWL